MAKSIDVSDLDIYYGDFLAVEGVSMTIPARSVTALIGPSGCGKSTFLRSLNRMHEVIPGARVEGKIVIDGQDLYGADVDPVEVRRQVGHGLPAAQPVPHHVDLRQRAGRLTAQLQAAAKAKADEIVERSLSGANLWTEVKDRLGKPGAGPVRRPAAAAVHRPGHRRGAAGAADGRALLGARPHLDLGHRGPHPRAAGRTTRSSS